MSNRYLATGEDMKSLAYNYRIGASTTAATIWETLGELKALVLPEPNEETWLEVGYFITLS